MDVAQYTQDGENVYCQTTIQKGETETDGSLACSDTRLIFAGKRKVVDIRLNAIHEIVYQPNPMPWGYILGTVGLLLMSLLLHLLAPNIPFLPPELATVVAVLIVIPSIVLAATAYNAMTETLIIRTPQNEHKFRGGGLSEFPHAIRGAAE